MQTMWPRGEMIHFLTVALILWLTPIVISRTLKISESQLEDNTNSMEYLALLNMARQEINRPENLSDIFNKAFAKHTLLRVQGLRRVFDYVRGKKSEPSNHHERRVIVGGICCNGKRHVQPTGTIVKSNLGGLLKRLEEVHKVVGKISRENEDLLHYENTL